MEPSDRDIFGSHEIAYECLADEDRTQNFAAAIAEVVQPGFEVIELGTGTGILSLLAARAGAARVRAYELSHPMAEMARRNVAANQLGDVIAVIEGDVTELPAVEARADVLIAEMISIGLVEEQLVPAFNQMLAIGALSDRARCIPSGQVTWLEVGDWDFDHLGFALPMIQIEQTWQRSHLRALLSAPVVVSDVDFEAAVAAQRPVAEDVEVDVTFTALATGTINAVRMGGESILSPTVRSGWTQCMNSPAVIPLPPREVTAGQAVPAHVTYRMGGEFSTFALDWAD